MINVLWVLNTIIIVACLIASSYLYLFANEVGDATFFMSLLIANYAVRLELKLHEGE